MPKTWFITGANRGFGAEIAKAALAAGDNVVATARSPATLTEALGQETAQLAFAAGDVTKPEEIKAAVALTAQKFGGISVLVNNAGYGHLGIFEELGPEDVATQFATNVHGVFNVLWAALPLMRAARAGHVINISSIAGLRGGPGGSIYAASKHAMEAVSESLAKELAPFGIKVTLVEPGFFRTDFLHDSMRFRSGAIADYAAASAQMQAMYEARNHKQAGDPVKLAAAIVRLAHEAEPPLRFLAGADAVAVLEEKISNLQRDLAAWRALSLSLAVDEA